MATSQNGYSANDRSVIASYTVPGTNLRVSLRKGDVSVVLLEYLRRYNLEVEPLAHNPQDLWGYAERTIRGSSTTLSNHASGTAVDCRATRHGLGQTGTFNARELGALNNLLGWFEGVLRHGKDYTGRKDPMHAEIDRGPPDVARIANKIRRAPAHGGGSSISAPARPKELPLMIERALAQGLSEGRIVCPTGSASSLVDQSWVSVSLAGGGRVQIWFQKGARSDAAPPGAGNPVDWTIFNAERPWVAVPSGTEYIEYRISADGPGSLLIEQKPK